MPHRIFIVEDHDWAREALVSLINLEEDLTVCGEAVNTAEALAALPADADLVIVDLAMPGGSGLQLLKDIRERWPDLPTIVFSGKPALEYEDAAREAGATGYVEKGDAMGLLDLLYRTLQPSP